MTPPSPSGEAPLASQGRLLAGLAGLALLLGLAVYVDVLPRLDAPPPRVEGRRIVPGSLGPLEAVDIVRGRKEFRLEKGEDGGWEIIDAEGRAPIVDGRGREFVEALRELVVLVEIGPAEETALADFGLEPADERITLIPEAGDPFEIQLGDRNPPLTGVYALIWPSGEVFLVGAVLLLEVDMVAALAASKAP